MKEILRSTWNAVRIVCRVRDKKLFALRVTLILVPCVTTAFATYSYMMSLAEPYTPPEGYVFPREPMLVGTYSHVVRGGRNYQSYVDKTPILCWGFSYYAGTLAQTATYGDCRGGISELEGKPVEVEQVRFPVYNAEASPLVSRMTSNGKVYLDRSDAWIREQWIRDTRDSARLTAEKLVLLMGMFVWLPSGWIVKKIEQGRNK